jgi:hypothetical protein
LASVLISLISFIVPTTVSVTPAKRIMNDLQAFLVVDRGRKFRKLILGIFILAVFVNVTNFPCQPEDQPVRN